MQRSVNKLPKTTNFKKTIALNYRLFKKTRALFGSVHHQPNFSIQHILLSWLGAFIGIAILAYLTVQTSYPCIAAPFGATAVLVFGVPDSPLAQPRNVIGGNLIAAIVCVTLVQLFGTAPWVMAMAVATTIKLTQLTRTVHPPSGAVALLGVLNNASWNYVLTPILLGSVVIVFCTVIYSSATPGRVYPKHWL
ncbi:MAG: HPP family protein [Mojavia pulchra JT2-VF2]|jgi:CBS-domain-containing membrane protein|uniref:HPP family protein n=1 Tax=Mojavia pulchra JT2-VF2 TaxID=287848 RepID=A0A951UGB3_9NOST|nr:HPP family protein [Mojavia pulchra JT2-VF2]